MMNPVHAIIPMEGVRMVARMSGAFGSHVAIVGLSMEATSFVTVSSGG